jgi:hypothetical protein
MSYAGGSGKMTRLIGKRRLSAKTFVQIAAVYYLGPDDV